MRQLDLRSIDADLVEIDVVVPEVALDRAHRTGAREEQSSVFLTEEVQRLMVVGPGRANELVLVPDPSISQSRSLLVRSLSRLEEQHLLVVSA